MNLSQYHGEGVPEFVGSLQCRSLHKGGRLSPDDGCAVSAGPVQHKGSYSTSLSIKSHAGWVRVSGNPSRFGRADNLFGYDLDTGVGVINAELRRLGLPEFTKGKYLGAGKWSGAAFARLDLTQNFATGSEVAARMAIRAYQSRSGAYLRAGNYGEETAQWTNTRRGVKCYRKAPEMLIHAPESEWITWAEDAGIVRVEVELKSRWLSGNDHRYWGGLTMGTLYAFYLKETDFLRGIDAEVSPSGVELVPRSARLVYAAWLDGRDPKALVSRATLFRHRKAVRESAGVDIARPRQGGTVVPLVRALELREAEAPAGYWPRKVAA